jgi:hypothetical protein
MSTVILPCVCRNEYQDARYGKGNRVFNFGPKASMAKGEGYRCTVCKRGVAGGEKNAK